MLETPSMGPSERRDLDPPTKVRLEAVLDRMREDIEAMRKTLNTLERRLDVVVAWVASRPV